MGFFSSSSLALLVFVAVSHFQEGAAFHPVCHKGWTYSNGFCYGIFLKPLSWFEAELQCQNYGINGHLAIIKNKQEAAVVVELLRVHRYFYFLIGLYGAPKGDWWWTDDTRSEYFLWGHGQPDFSANLEYYCGQYAYTKGQWGWVTTNCYLPQPYICKYQA